MKKIFTVCGIVCVFVLMTACTTSRQTISTSTYLNEIGDVNKSIEQLGYKLSGTSSDQKNEVYVSATSYSTQTGYGSAMGNDYYWYDTYRFLDSLNNTVSYQVKYKFGKDKNDVNYISGVSVIDCNCSNVKDYNVICKNPVGVRKLNNIKNDQVSTFKDNSSTVALIWSVVIGLELAAAIIIILL